MPFFFFFLKTGHKSGLQNHLPGPLKSLWLGLPMDLMHHHQHKPSELSLKTPDLTMCSPVLHPSTAPLLSTAWAKQHSLACTIFYHHHHFQSYWPRWRIGRFYIYIWIYEFSWKAKGSGKPGSNLRELRGCCCPAFLFPPLPLTWSDYLPVTYRWIHSIKSKDALYHHMSPKCSVNISRFLNITFLQSTLAFNMLPHPTHTPTNVFFFANMYPIRLFTWNYLCHLISPAQNNSVLLLLILCY